MNNETKELLSRVMTRHDDGAAYELLLVRFRPLLCKIMITRDIPQEAHYDLLMDFYLHLRDGRGQELDKRVPFATMMTLSDPDSFPAWIGVVFTRWLSRRFGEEASHEEVMRQLAEMSDETDENNVSFADLYMAILVIETINETFSAPERMVFFTELSAICDNTRPGPELEEVLQATSGNVRVMQTRVRKKVKRIAKDVKRRFE